MIPSLRPAQTKALPYLFSSLELKWCIEAWDTCGWWMIRWFLSLITGWVGCGYLILRRREGGCICFDEEGMMSGSGIVNYELGIALDTFIHSYKPTYLLKCLVTWTSLLPLYLVDSLIYRLSPMNLLCRPALLLFESHKRLHTNPP